MSTWHKNRHFCFSFCLNSGNYPCHCLFVYFPNSNIIMVQVPPSGGRLCDWYRWSLSSWTETWVFYRWFFQAVEEYWLNFADGTRYVGDLFSDLLLFLSLLPKYSTTTPPFRVPVNFHIHEWECFSSTCLNLVLIFRWWEVLVVFHIYAVNWR